MSQTHIDLVSTEYLSEQLSGKADTSSLGTAAAKDYATSIAENGTGLPTSGTVYTALSGKLGTGLKGAANGLAELDTNGRVPSSQLPSYVDDTIEGYLKAENGKFYKESTYTTEITGETGKIYVTLDTNKTYRWSGSAFVEISASLALGETSSTAYRGDRGKTAYDDSQTNKANIGTLSNLTTIEKSTLVGATNELNSNKQPKTMSSPVTIGGTSRTTVESAISALQTAKQDNLTFDNVPTASSNNPVKSGGVYSSIKNVSDYINYDYSVYGLEADMENKTFTRLAGAAWKTAGSDFDSCRAFGGRRRCNLTDDGAVTAYYGDSAYTETGALTAAVTVNGVTYPVGTHVQTMVECPRFYYKIVPIKVTKLKKGWSLQKAQYFVSDKPREGFKIHPEFVRGGKEREYVYHSAFEGSLYDTSAGAYITDDAQVADFGVDLLSSVAGSKPISGKTQNLTRANSRKIAENRGVGWEQQTIQAASATQLLMLIEYGTFNMQSALSAGNSTKTDDGSTSMSEVTGATTSLGNASGEVTNGNNIKLFSYRGEENPYANIWKWVDGLNKYNQDVYIADHGFADDTATGYKDAGITACASNGYIKAFCYSEDFDWLFVPAEVGGDSALPVGDYYWYANGWRVAGLGGIWYDGAYDGAFYLVLDNTSSHRYRNVSGRLLYIPDSSQTEESSRDLADFSPFSVVDGMLCITYQA